MQRQQPIVVYTVVFRRVTLVSFTSICVCIFLLLGSITIPTADAQVLFDDTVKNEYSLSRVKVNSNDEIIDIITAEWHVFTTHLAYNLFIPGRAMLPPKSWSTFCGTTGVPNATDQEIKQQNRTTTTNTQTQNERIFLLMNTFDSTNQYCSKVDIFENVFQLNRILSLIGLTISVLIFPQDITQTETETEVSFGYFSELDWVFVSSNVSEKIEKSILFSANTANTSPYFLDTQGSEKWSYYMSLTEDFNYDDKINIKDYELYHSSPGYYAPAPTVLVPSAPTVPSSYSGTINTDPPPAPFVMMIIALIGICLIASGIGCVGICMFRSFIYRMRSFIYRMNNSPTTSRSTNGINQRATQLNNNTNNSTITTQPTENKNSLSEVDFASLPLMKYHAKKSLTSTNKDNDTNVCNVEQSSSNSPATHEVITNQADVENSLVVTTCTQEGVGDGSSSICRSESVFCEEYGQSLKAIECCSICLEEFNEDEVVTALPRCCHLFHTTCIRQWLIERKSNVCPLCKSLVMEQHQL